MIQNQILLLYLLSVFVIINAAKNADVHLQTLNGRVHAGNFTYYKLYLKGCILITLHSLKGDCDLYLSSTTMAPTWEDYDFKSDTCGYDEVILERDVPRPLAVGVYGYIRSNISDFALEIFLSERSCKNWYPDDYGKWDSTIFPQHQTNLNVKSNDVPEEPEESVIWTVLSVLLKIFFDALIS